MNNSTNQLHAESLGDLATVRRGITYSATMLVERDCGIPYVNMKSFKKGGGFNWQGIKYYGGVFTQDDLTKETDLLIVNTDVTPEGDIVGTPAFLPGEFRNSPVLFSHHVTRLRFEEKIDPEYLFYLLCTDGYRRWMLRYARGTTVLMLDMAGIKRIPVMYHALKTNQERIVNIIRTIDRTIERTEVLIEKYQQIKAGLMQDLFTRGIGADGKLRPPSEQAPELYRETQIGGIPKEWDCVNLNQVADLVVGFAFKSEWFQEDGVNLLRGENVGYGNPDWKDKRCLSYEKAQRYNEYLLHEGDIVIGMDRTFTKSGVKITVMRSFDCPSLLVQRVGKFVATSCYDLYLRWLVLSPKYLRHLMNQQKGMDIPHLSKSEILEPFIPLPPEKEQREIALRIDLCNSNIQKEIENLEKLIDQKSGLMHDLLTGKVQVKVEAKQPEAAHV